MTDERKEKNAKLMNLPTKTIQNNEEGADLPPSSEESPLTTENLSSKKKGEKAVVFSYLVKPLNLLKKKLDENKIKSVIFDGQLDQNDRSKRWVINIIQPHIIQLIPMWHCVC